MDYRETPSLIFARLHQDEDVFASLKEIATRTNLKVGIVVSGIGMLREAELSFFVRHGQYSSVHFPEALELVSLTGSIIHQGGDYLFHLHAVLADEHKKTVAGHLSKGRVNVTNEIVILKTDVPAERKLDEATGLMGLSFR
jgi:predicted DNA-binding protein with PD1-like motif